VLEEFTIAKKKRTIYQKLNDIQEHKSGVKHMGAGKSNCSRYIIDYRQQL